MYYVHFVKVDKPLKRLVYAIQFIPRLKPWARIKTEVRTKPWVEHKRGLVIKRGLYPDFSK
jgi:hypothetical protein